MSHSKERTEKNCLNCNAEVLGRYCHVCGQENIEINETAWHLVTHYFSDLFHFDGKFFRTLSLLVRRPGFLSKEYMTGRRASYLNPVKMYVFTSALFFIIFFTFTNLEDARIGEITINDKTSSVIDKMDSSKFADFTREINRKDSKPDIPMTRAEYATYRDSVKRFSGLNLTDKHYRSKGEYDSVLASGKKKHNWFERQLIYRQIRINEKYHNNVGMVLQSFREKLLHSLPQMIFISLPLFALLLKLYYIRHKKIYYVNHAIFTVHFFIFLFITMMVLFGISKLDDQLKWGVFDFLSFLIYLGLFFYEYKALRKFYLQRRAKTILKFFLLNISFFIVLILLFAVFVFFSFFKM